MITAKVTQDPAARVKELARTAATPAYKKAIVVGVFATATYATPDGKGERVADVARANDKGTVTAGGFIPPRPFLTRSFSFNKNTLIYAKHFNKRMKTNFKKTLNLSEAYLLTLQSLTSWVRGRVQHRIKNWSQPPNAPSTVERKGEDAPLRDTGTLRRSIAAIVK